LIDVIVNLDVYLQSFPSLLASLA